MTKQSTALIVAIASLVAILLNNALGMDVEQTTIITIIDFGLALVGAIAGHLHGKHKERGE